MDIFKKFPIIKTGKILSVLKYPAVVSLIGPAVWIFLNTVPPFSLHNNAYAAYRIISASIFVLILPGYLLFNILQMKKKYHVDMFELLVTSFGISVIVIELLCIATFELSLNITKAGYALSVISLIMLIAGYVIEQKKKIHCADGGRAHPDIDSIVIYGLIIIGFVITSIVLYGIESPVSGGEDQLHISIIRKILENTAIIKSNIFYKPNAVYTYIYPGLHFAISLISRFSGLDPIVLYAKLRFVLGILSLLIIWTFSKALFRSKYAAFTITLTCQVLIYNGIAGRLTGFFCGQLVPLSHISDISMGILLPLLLIFSFKYIVCEKAVNRYYFFYIFLFVATTIIHVREGVQVIFYYIATAGACFLFNKKNRQMLRKISVLLISMILLGLIIKSIYPVKHIKQSELTGKDHAIEMFVDLTRNPRAALSASDKYPYISYFVRFEKLLHKKYIFTAMPLSLLILLLFRHEFWGLFLSSSVIASFMVMKVNILSVLLVIFTYSEILFTPARFILFISYIIFGLFIYMLIIGCDRI